MLLDTFAWIEFFNGTEKGLKVKQLLKENACFTSAICLAELSEWIERNGLDRKEKMNAVKKLSSIIGLDEQTLELAGLLKVKKRKTVKGFGMLDAIILATAKQYKLKIVTGDKHFKEENAMLL